MRIKVWFTSLVTLFFITLSPLAIANSNNNEADSSAALDIKIVESIKQTFAKRFPGIDIDNVQKSPVPGLFEVQVDTDIVYVDEKVDYLIQGAVIEAKTRLNLTEQRMQQLSAVPFEDLPLDLAIKQVRGDGSRKIAIFEDPNCGFCKQLQKDLVKGKNITVYSFLYPMLSEDSVLKTRDVLCAKDSSKVWYDWMVNGIEPAENNCNDHNIEELLKLGSKLSVRGTPAIFFEDGFRASGALPLAQIHQKLDEINK